MLVHGQVQGVGFRYMAVNIARKYEITGKVKNLMDGNVYIEAFGKEAELENFIKEIKASPFPSHVADVEISYCNTDDPPRRFRVAY